MAPPMPSPPLPPPLLALEKFSVDPIEQQLPALDLVAAYLARKAAVGPAPELLPLEPSLNPEFVAMPTEELITHLNHHRFIAHFVALMVVVFERRLAEAEELVHACDECMDMLQDVI